MCPDWGSHSRTSHSVLKSVPKMEKKHKVIKIFNGEEYRMYEGYGTESRGPIKKMHKKKRRQAFKNELRGEL
jgi:hypothetical protein